MGKSKTMSQRAVGDASGAQDFHTYRAREVLKTLSAFSESAGQAELRLPAEGMCLLMGMLADELNFSKKGNAHDANI